MGKVQSRHLPNKVQVILSVLVLGSFFASIWVYGQFPDATWSIALLFAPSVLMIACGIYIFFVRSNQDELQARIMAGSGAATLWVMVAVFFGQLQFQRMGGGAVTAETNLAILMCVWAVLHTIFQRRFS